MTQRKRRFSKGSESKSSSIITGGRYATGLKSTHITFFKKLRRILRIQSRFQKDGGGRSELGGKTTRKGVGLFPVERREG